MTSPAKHRIVRRIVRRLWVAIAVLVALLLAAVLALRWHGRHHLAEAEARFVQALGPLPDFPPDATLEDAQRGSDEVARHSLARLGEAKAAGDAALLAWRIGDRQSALEQLGQVVETRDELLQRPALLAQLVGVAVAEKALEIAEAMVQAQDLGGDELRALSAALEAPPTNGWNGAMIHEASLSRLWLREEHVGGLEGAALRLEMPYTFAANLGIYLGLAQAVSDRAPDVDEHVRRTYRKTGSAWMDPVAEILIPNLVAAAEKRIDYLQHLDELRARLGRRGAAASGSPPA